jgi:hypothetical protein
LLRISHCLHNRLTDGGEVVSPTHRPRSTPQKRYFSVSGTHFCYRLSEPQGLRTRDLPAYSLVPQPLRYRVLLATKQYKINMTIRFTVCPSVQNGFCGGFSVGNSLDDINVAFRTRVPVSWVRISTGCPHFQQPHSGLVLRLRQGPFYSNYFYFGSRQRCRSFADGT